MSEDEVNPQEVILIPVDDEDHVLLYSDVKIESVDSTYRTVSDPKGLTWRLSPGDYNVRIFLRTLEMRTIPLKVTEGGGIYKICVERKGPKSTTGKVVEKPVEKSAVIAEPVRPSAPPSPPPEPVPSHASRARLEDKSTVVPRLQTTFPVSYRTGNGQWINSKSVNLSTTGVCVESVGHIGDEETLYVRLHVPVSSVPIECPARVVWIKIQDVPRPRMGLQLYLTDNMRTSIANWLSLIRKG